MKDRKNRKDFYKGSFIAIVARTSTAEGGRFNQYTLSNGLQINFFTSARNQLEVGDSIQKEKNTFLYKVYRKDISGQNQFLAVYDFTVLK